MDLREHGLIKTLKQLPLVFSEVIPPKDGLQFQTINSAQWAQRGHARIYAGRKNNTPMKKEMLINVSQPEECRIAILEDQVLEELYVERASADNYVGNIYKGKVVNLEPAIQAAFDRARGMAE